MAEHFAVDRVLEDLEAALSDLRTFCLDKGLTSIAKKLVVHPLKELAESILDELRAELADHEPRRTSPAKRPGRVKNSAMPVWSPSGNQARKTSFQPAKIPRGVAQ